MQKFRGIFIFTRRRVETPKLVVETPNLGVSTKKPAQKNKQTPRART